MCAKGATVTTGRAPALSLRPRANPAIPKPQFVTALDGTNDYGSEFGIHANTPQPEQPIPVPKPEIVRPPTPVEEPQPEKGPDLPQPGPDVVIPPGPEVITPPQPQEIPPTPPA